MKKHYIFCLLVFGLIALMPITTTAQHSQAAAIDVQSILDNIPQLDQLKSRIDELDNRAKLILVYIAVMLYYLLIITYFKST